MRRSLRLIFLTLLVLGALALRWYRIDRPIWNLDEGSTFTMAEQVLAGGVLYRDAADNRSPLMPYLKAAVFAVAGKWNAFAVHFVLALMMGACAVLLWRIAKRFGDERTGVVAALFFTVLSFTLLDPADAISANTGWFLVTFSTAGFAVFAWGLTRPGFGSGLLAGFLFGCSFLCKQPGLFDFAVMWVLLGMRAIERRTDRPALGRLGLGALVGAAVPVLAFVAYFAAEHALPDMVYYAYTFNTRIYIPEVPRLERLAGMRMPFLLAWRHAPASFVLGLAGAAAAFVAAVQSLRRRPLAFPLLPWLALGWTAAGILSTGLSGRTFSHYSAQVAPGLSLLCGWAVARALEWLRDERRRNWRRAAPALLGAVALALGWSVARRVRELGPQDQMPLLLGRTAAAFSGRSERIFVWGYYPELYFFAQRLPASRFIYTNYVTGMIAWTNLDPLVDTTYGMSPGAWAQLAEDLRRHPPAVIVDTGATRGYSKYPLRDQPLLWDLVRHDYVEVAGGAGANFGMRFFRRIGFADNAPLDGTIPESPAIRLEGKHRWLKNEPPRLQVVAAAGASRVELYAGGRRIALIEHPATLPVDVRFFVDPDAPGSHDLRAVVTVRGIRSVSPAFDFASFARRVTAVPPPGAPFDVAGAVLQPLAVDYPLGGTNPSDDPPGTWSVNTPAEIEYPCPAGVHAIDFVHGLHSSVGFKSDGYDLVVDLRAGGVTRRLYLHRAKPRRLTADRLMHHVAVAVPPHPDGQLVFRFLPGPSGSPDFDWVYFGRLQGQTDGPPLVLGQEVTLPIASRMGAGEPWKRQLDGTWIAHSPARIEWPCPANLATLTLKYGMDEGSYTAANGHTDGVDVVLDLVEPNGQVHSLFRREVTPFNHPEHRGPQSSLVEVPVGLAGKLVLQVGPGPRGDTSWDWAWVGLPVCEGPGPSIVVSRDRKIVPVSSRVVDAHGGPSKRIDATHWGAHADAELVYNRPADLGRVIFRYGLADGADRDANGRRRSAGVDVLVQFEPAGGPLVELFRRRLDPYVNAKDLGEQTSTVELPPYDAGRLIFRITPGPSAGNAYDWGYWGTFDGELSR